MTPNQSAPNLDPGLRRRIALLALCLAGFVIQLDVTISNVALPTIRHDLDAATGALEWIISGYALGLAALIPLLGALGDRLGHRPVLLTGLVVFGLCSAGAALAPNSSALIAARVGQGVGGAAILALTLAVLSDTYPLAQRGHAIGWWAALGGLGFGAGPIVGGLLLSAFGWSTIFWVNLPIVAIAVGLILLAVPRVAAASDPRPLDVPGVVLASLGLAAVTFGLITASETPWNPVPTLMPLILGALTLAAFVPWQRRAREPLVPRTVRGNTTFISACAIYFLSYLAFSGTLYYVTLMFQNLLGWSALRTGLSWLLMNVPFLLAAQTAGNLAQRFTPRAIVTTGCASGALGIVALSTMTAATSFTVAALGYLVAGGGFGLLVPGITYVAMRDVAAPVSGAASALLNSSRQLGTAVGLALVGAVGATVSQHRWGASRYGQAHVPSSSIAAGSLDGLPPRMQATASDAFEIGYHVALGVCIVSLLVAVWLSAHAFKQKTAPRIATAKEPSR